MSLLEGDYDKDILPVVNENETVGQVLQRLNQAGGTDDWHLVLEINPGSFKVMRVSDFFRGFLTQMGPGLFDTSFGELSTRMSAADGVAA